MTKENGKKIMGKRRLTVQTNATIKKVKGPAVSTTPTNPVPSTGPEEAQNKEKEMGKVKHLSGFIFMCNPSTKLECYQNRVFGLPFGKKEVVEQIKPGTKLFLFDFELKLLYGIYEATSTGKLNLEPTAFKGKFPAQVKFRIFKECLPLAESSLRHVILENYAGSKFRQELTGKQVKKLISSFRPLNASSTSLSQPASRAHVSLSRPIPPPVMQNQFRHTAPPTVKVPYLYERQYGRIPNSTLIEPRPVSKDYLQHGYHRTASYMEHMNPNLDHRSLPTTSSYYVANSQRSSFTEGVALGVQDPSYSRYGIIDERAPHPRPPNDQVSSLDRRYMTVEAMAPRDQVTVSESQYQHHHHQLLPQRQALYQDNITAYNNPQYTSSVSQPNVHPPYYPLPLQINSQYQDSAVAYNSNPSAAAAQYSAPLQINSQYQDSAVAYNSNPSAAAAQYNASASTHQIGVPPTYHQLPSQGETVYQDNVGAYNNSYTGASAQYAQYASSATQPQVAAAPVVSSQASAPVSAYDSYNAANWQSH